MYQAAQQQGAQQGPQGPGAGAQTPPGEDKAKAGAENIEDADYEVVDDK